jgi:hypothetical protein
MEEDYPNKFPGWQAQPSLVPMFKLGNRLVHRMSGSVYRIVNVQLARDPQTNTELSLFGLQHEEATDDMSYSGLLSATRLAESFYVLR